MSHICVHHFRHARMKCPAHEIDHYTTAPLAAMRNASHGPFLTNLTKTTRQRDWKLLDLRSKKSNKKIQQINAQRVCDDCVSPVTDFAFVETVEHV